MKLDELLRSLGHHRDKALQIALPDGSLVPAHFHVTEVGRVQKDFIDCGGTMRSTTTCVLQVWVAHDLEHRLVAAKLAKIIELASPALRSTEMEVEIEYEAEVISQYPLLAIEESDSALCLQVGHKHTACLAEDRCKIPALPLASGNCSAPGCC